MEPDGKNKMSQTLPTHAEFLVAQQMVAKMLEDFAEDLDATNLENSGDQ